MLSSFAVLLAPRVASPSEPVPENIWGRICSYAQGETISRVAWSSAHLPPARCTGLPNVFRTLPSVGDDRDTSASFQIGYDPDNGRICFVSNGLSEAPVLRVGAGHTLSIQISNTLIDTGPQNTENCLIDTFGESTSCAAKPIFAAAPGADGSFYPLMADQAHVADGTSNLHVHGLFVSPHICSDEVLRTTIYPANWHGPEVPEPSCQSAPNTLTYTYQLPAYHPAGVYWYHTHRHGQSEHQTQMGLVGAIVVEDAGDAYRRSIGVSDEVLLVTDTPVGSCVDGESCETVGRMSGHTQRQAEGDAARRKARAAIDQMAPSDPVDRARPVLDPRIDQVDQAGECAAGATNSQGGYELWKLQLNGAPVPEVPNAFPPDSALLRKHMQPGQRQIFRLVNATANSFVAPRLVQVQDGVRTVLPLEVFARDGVGLADAEGNRHFTNFDVSQQKFTVPPAGRVEFVVHAPPAGAKLYLDSDQVDPGCGGNLYPARRMLLIESSGTPVDPGAPDDSDLLVNTPSLAPYLATLGTVPSVQRTFVLSEYGRGFTYGVTKWLKKAPAASDYDPTQTDFYLTPVASSDGEVNPAQTALVPFVPNAYAPPVVVHLHGQESVTEEWLVENSTLEIHAFHIHQIHFRDVTTPSSDPDLQPMLDTIVVPAAPLIGDVATGYPGASGYVRLRMTFTRKDIGEFVFHCHILEHEDNGMMARIVVTAN